jgi:hypothetical protein
MASSGSDNPEVAVARADLAIEALSGHIDAEAAGPGWTNECREDALLVLGNWRDDLQEDGVVHPTMSWDGVAGLPPKASQELSSPISRIPSVPCP